MLSLIGVLMFACAASGLLAFYQRRKQALRGAQPPDGELLIPEPAPESFFDRWERMALQAALPYRRSAYWTVILLGLAAAVLLLVLREPLAAGVATVAGLGAPYIYVRWMRSVRSAMFARQLPQALFLASSVLRGGGTLLQAVDAIAQEMPDPMGHEFRIIQQEMRLQYPAHEAMARAQARIGVREFAAVVVAARITAEVGGNLAHIYDEIARSILDAENASRTVIAFTTEGRMSANLIASLPIVVLALMQVLSPTYFKPMFATWPGRLVLIGCFAAIFIGWRVIRRMVSIRIF